MPPQPEKDIPEQAAATAITAGPKDSEAKVTVADMEEATSKASDEDERKTTHARRTSAVEIKEVVTADVVSTDATGVPSEVVGDETELATKAVDVDDDVTYIEAAEPPASSEIAETDNSKSQALDSHDDASSSAAAAAVHNTIGTVEERKDGEQQPDERSVPDTEKVQMHNIEIRDAKEPSATSDSAKPLIDTETGVEKSQETPKPVGMNSSMLNEDEKHDLERPEVAVSASADTRDKQDATDEAKGTEPEIREASRQTDDGASKVEKTSDVLEEEEKLGEASENEKDDDSDSNGGGSAVEKEEGEADDDDDEEDEEEEEEEALEKPRVQIYGSTVSGNRTYKKQAKDLFIMLEGNEIDFEFICIAADQKAKLYMRRKALGNMSIPQIFVDGEFKGLYEDAFNANEKDELYEWLGLDEEPLEY
ncbi:hypothetical protein LPJ72_002044 [Coemansia sp. Benny D160-2]|nr:hypothetical protein LPJ72_002044 [Coemansia sp. Benny D160-2]